MSFQCAALFRLRSIVGELIRKWKVNNGAHLNRFASSMNGRFCISESSFHSAPNRLLISELCILGFSTAICRRWPRLHTINAFIGRLMWLELWSMLPCDVGWPFDEKVVIFAFDIVKIFIPSRNSRILSVRFNTANRSRSTRLIASFDLHFKISYRLSRKKNQD